MTTTPIIFDTDPGVDDAQAIALILADPAIEVVGMTTTYGNVPVETATSNALLLTELAGQTVPVAQGAARPLSKTPNPFPTFVHGVNGLGDIDLPSPKTQAVDQTAAQFLVEKTKERPGELTLVAVGPLGNLATALQIDPNIVDRVKQVVIMGGSVKQGGNVTPVAEANIYSDPHAAQRVFNAGWPVVMVGLDVTHKTHLSPDRMARIQAAQGELGRVLGESYGFYADFYRKALGIDGCCPHDSCAVAWLKKPELFKTVRGHLNVVTEGLAQGQTVFAPEEATFAEPRWSQTPLIDVCMDIDGDAVSQWIEDTLTT
ncbi:nucleoside hydrolase [Larsenimonas suaedae]|uniref:Nucleoside hydrolase n=1 Tax=Larsenimonas suaedae TaxID=1851019 RepID=A0ABU1GX52_9GAMM|nr:nucleoside hydrolase [Larsenimonas suaedae]MCM2971374.1 nucleoside hydrolase [Larsenimonas suaedae]MDR5896630.1 nucleoside hydrolase [Larsenimonas suaedae]